MYFASDLKPFICDCPIFSYIFCSSSYNIAFPSPEPLLHILQRMQSSLAPVLESEPPAILSLRRVSFEFRYPTARYSSRSGGRGSVATHNQPLPYWDHPNFYQIKCVHSAVYQQQKPLHLNIETKGYEKTKDSKNDIRDKHSKIRFIGHWRN